MMRTHVAFNRGIAVAFETLGLEKTAVSAELMQRLLAARKAQGVRFSPSMVGKITQDLAEYGPEARSRLRNAALSAGESARASAAMERAVQNPVTQGMRGRVNEAWEAALTGAPGVRNYDRPLRYDYDFGATGVSGAEHAYSKEHINRMMGESSLVDPRGVMSSRPVNRGLETVPNRPRPNLPGLENTGLAAYHPMAFESTSLVPGLPPPVAAPAIPNSPKGPRVYLDTMPGKRITAKPLQPFL